MQNFIIATHVRYMVRWVARRDALGNLLETAVFKAARLAALKRARAFWNLADKSSAARYEEANDESESDA